MIAFFEDLAACTRDFFVIVTMPGGGGGDPWIRVTLLTIEGRPRITTAGRPHQHISSGVWVIATISRSMPGTPQT